MMSMSLLNFIPKKFTCFVNHNNVFRNTLFLPVLRNLRSKSYFRTALVAFPTLQNSTSAHKHDFCSKAFTVNGDESSKSSFQQMLRFRKKQAQCTVLIELSKKEYVTHALSSCEEFGVIKNAFSYSGVSENVFLLLEFEKEESARQLLLSSCYKNISDVFPVFSRFIGCNGKYEQNESNSSVHVVEEVPTMVSSKGETVSNLIENIYTSEKLSELNIRLRFFFCIVVKEYMAGLFPFCDAIPFGSSVNGVGRQGCDLDLMIRLYPDKIDSSSELYFVNKTCVGDLQNLQRKVVWCIADLLRTFSPGVTSVQKILNARVPIVKLDHKILGMQIDISVNNMAPILMSELLHFCGEVDSRIRPLIYAVKKWARETSVTYDTPGSWITNFGLSLLVIFFLQNRPLPILPPLIEAINIKGAECTTEYKLEYLMPLSELKVKASANTESLALLLKEFLAYVGSHPFENRDISLLSGTARERNIQCPIWLQYPFEEDANVSKNVSEHELWDMCEKARVSANYLGAALRSRNSHSKDLSVLLGIPNLRKLDTDRAKPLDVSSLLSNDLSKNSNKKSGRRRAF